MTGEHSAVAHSHVRGRGADRRSPAAVVHQAVRCLSTGSVAPSQAGDRGVRAGPRVAVRSTAATVHAPRPSSAPGSARRSATRPWPTGSPRTCSTSTTPSTPTGPRSTAALRCGQPSSRPVNWSRSPEPPPSRRSSPASKCRPGSPSRPGRATTTPAGTSPAPWDTSGLRWPPPGCWACHPDRRSLRSEPAPPRRQA